MGAFRMRRAVYFTLIGTICAFAAMSHLTLAQESNLSPLEAAYFRVFRVYNGGNNPQSIRVGVGAPSSAPNDGVIAQLKLTGDELTAFKDAASSFAKEQRWVQAETNAIVAQDLATHPKTHRLSALAKAQVHELFGELELSAAHGVESIHRDLGPAAAERLDAAVMHAFGSTTAPTRAPVGSPIRGGQRPVGSDMNSLKAGIAKPMMTNNEAECLLTPADELQDEVDDCGDEGGDFDYSDCGCNGGDDGGGGGGGGGGGPMVDQTPVITSITPVDWLSGTTTNPVTINGLYFGTNAPSLSFSPGSGISYTILTYSNTQITASIKVQNGTPDELVSVSVTSNGYGGNAFYGGGVNSPTGTDSSQVEVTQSVGNIYLVDPYLSPLSGSTSITPAAVISAINNNYSSVKANGLITDGTATAIAVYANAVGFPVTFTGTEGITFATYNNSFLNTAPASGVETCSTDTSGCTVTTTTENGVTYSFVLVHAPPQTTTVPYGNETASVNAAVSDTNSSTEELSLGPTPVVFLHGLWGNASSLSSVSTTLAGQQAWQYGNSRYPALNTPCYSLYLPFDATSDTLSGSGTGCEFTSQAALTNQINTIQSKLDSLGFVGGRVDLVVHSMGGLAARNYSKLSTYKTTRSLMKGLFRSVVTIDTPENGSALAPFLLQNNVAGGTCSTSATGPCFVLPPSVLPSDIPGLLWLAACHSPTTTLAACLAGKGNPLGPPGTGPGGFNNSECPGSGAANTPSVGAPSCGAVASLTPGGQNISALPAPAIPGATWTAIGADWQDTPTATSSILRSSLNTLLAALSISNPPPTLSGVLSSIDNDVIVTESSQFYNDAGMGYAQFPNLAHSSAGSLMNLISQYSSFSNANVTQFPGVANCVASVLMASPATVCLGYGASSAAAGTGSESMPDEPGVFDAEAIQQPQTVFGETAEERTEQLSHPQTYAPRRLAVETPRGDVPLGSALTLPLTFSEGRVVDMYVKQADKNGVIEQASNLPVKIVQDEGLKKSIEIVPAQLGPLTVEVGAIYLDNAWAVQTIQLNVVPSAKGLKKFSLDGGSDVDTLVLEDDEKDRQLWLRPEVIYEQLPNPVFLNDSTQIKLSIEQNEGNPVIRVENNGLVHALSEGNAVIVGDFDGVIEKLKITVYSKDDAPAGYRKSTQ